MSGELPFCASVRVRTAPHFTVVPLPLVLLPSSDSLVSWPPSSFPGPSLCSYASSPRPLVHVPSCMLYICTYIHPYPFFPLHPLSFLYIHPSYYITLLYLFPFSHVVPSSTSLPYAFWLWPHFPTSVT